MMMQGYGHGTAAQGSTGVNATNIPDTPVLGGMPQRHENQTYLKQMTDMKFQKENYQNAVRNCEINMDRSNPNSTGQHFFFMNQNADGNFQMNNTHFNNGNSNQQQIQYGFVENEQPQNQKNGGKLLQHQNGKSMAQGSEASKGAAGAANNGYNNGSQGLGDMGSSGK